MAVSHQPLQFSSTRFLHPLPLHSLVLLTLFTRPAVQTESNFTSVDAVLVVSLCCERIVANSEVTIRSTDVSGLIGMEESTLRQAC